MSDNDAEVERLRAERDALQAEVVTLKERKATRPRRFGVGVLVIFSCLCLVLGVVGTWARRNALDNKRFTGRIEHIANSPAVKQAVSIRLGNEIVTLIDAKAFFESVLPERGQLLAVPLSNALNGFVRDRVDKFVDSERFERIFVAVASQAHRTAVNVIREKSNAIASTKDGKVELNLLPALDAVLAQITAQTPEIMGRQVDIPDVTVEDLPAAARARLEKALGVQLDDDFGQITVFDSKELATVQDGVRIFDRATWLLLLLAPVLAALALWLAPKRRRTLLQLCVGVIVGMVLVRRLGFRLQEEVTALPPTVRGQEAAGVVVGEFVDPLTLFCLWVSLVALGAAVIAAVTGPYHWAVRLREGTVSLAGRIATPAKDAAHDEQVVAWMQGHRDTVMTVGAVVGLVILWTADLSWFGLVLVLTLLALFELAAYRVGTPPEGPAAAS